MRIHYLLLASFLTGCTVPKHVTPATVDVQLQAEVDNRVSVAADAIAMYRDSPYAALEATELQQALTDLWACDATKPTYDANVQKLLDDVTALAAEDQWWSQWFTHTQQL